MMMMIIIIIQLRYLCNCVGTTALSRLQQQQKSI